MVRKQGTRRVRGFADFGTHQIDMLRWMFGAEVTGVSGRLANLLHKVEEVDDYGVATLQFENGVIATVESSWVTHGPGTNALFIQGTAGSITLDDTLRVNTPKMTWEVKDTSKEYLSVHGINLRVDGFRQVLDNFVACVTGEESDAACFARGRRGGYEGSRGRLARQRQARGFLACSWMRASGPGAFRWRAKPMPGGDRLQPMPSALEGGVWLRQLRRRRKAPFGKPGTRAT